MAGLIKANALSISLARETKAMTIQVMINTSRPAPRMDLLKKTKKGSFFSPPIPSETTVSSSGGTLFGCKMCATNKAFITFNGIAVNTNSAGIIWI